MRKLVFLSLIVSSILVGDDINNQVSLDELLLPLRNELYDVKVKAAEEKGVVTKYDWLGDINVNVSTTTNQNDDRTNDYSLSLTQEIFKFGGITAQYNYGEYQKELELLEASMEKKDDVLSLYENLINLKINDILIQQNELNVKNAQIDVMMKKSAYNQGESDISDLNDAIMNKNSLEDSKMELEVNKQIYINEIKKLTDVDFLKLQIPEVQLMSKDNYIEYSSQIKYATLQLKASKEQYKITRSDYLPTLSLNGSVGYSQLNEENRENYFNYGATISMPLSLKSKSAIEYGKLQSLQYKKELGITTIELEQDYDTALKTVDQYDKRINLAISDINLYDELLKLNTDEYNAGFKSIEDVETIRNSKAIRELDIIKYELYQRLEILKLYYEMI